MSHKQIAEQIRELINAPGAWTQGAFARERDGKKCISNSPEAVCWCAYGAMIKVGKPLSAEEFTAFFAEFDAAAKSLYHKQIVDVNDELGLEAINKVLEEIIQAGPAQ